MTRMPLMVRWKYHLILLLCLVCTASFYSVNTAYTAEVLRGANKDDNGYTKYHNKRFGFSFQYPEEWEINEPFNGGGVTIAPKQGPNVSFISAGGKLVQADETGHALTLEEDFESSLTSMRKWRPHATRHIKSVVVGKKETIKFLDFPAIAYTITYEVDGEPWINKGITFHMDDDRYSFGISISCHPDELSVFQPVYDKVVETFRIPDPPDEH